MFNGLKSESCRRILLVTQATFERPHNIVWNLQTVLQKNHKAAILVLCGLQQHEQTDTAGHVFVTSAENDMHPQATD